MEEARFIALCFKLARVHGTATTQDLFLYRDDRLMIVLDERRAIQTAPRLEVIGFGPPDQHLSIVSGREVHRLRIATFLAEHADIEAHIERKLLLDMLAEAAE